MFNFEKEVILNNLDGVVVLEDGTGVRIDGMVYKYANMGDVVATEGEVGKCATVTVDASKVADDKAQQMYIELGLDNNYRGDFGSALFYFRKPLVMDLSGKVDEATLVAGLKKLCAANGDVMKYDEADKKLVATEKYMTIVKAVIKDLDEDGDVIAETEMAHEDGVADRYTAEYLIHNLRLPTYANLRFASPAVAEMPTASLYNCYRFEYTVERKGLGGMSAAGQKVVSTTVHTFYVPVDCAEAFNGMLSAPAKDDNQDEE